MRNQKILYEADLQKTAKAFKLGAISLTVILVIGFVWCLLGGAFPGNFFLLAIVGIAIAGTACQLIRISKWRQGTYRIHLDSIGLHVHSDEPALGDSFSVAVLNLHRLVKKRVGNGEDIEYEYFVEEKTGQRHKISTALTNYNLNVMTVFEEIANEFPAVKIVGE